MHIPDGLLSPIILVILWIITIIVLVFSFYRVKTIFEDEDSEKIVPYIGVLAATIFAFQFVNYPVPGGTSGHLVGGVLVAVILGPWASLIVLFLVLVVQSLLIGDGGITAIGANTFNMGVIGGILGFYIVKLVVKALNKAKMSKQKKMAIATAIGAYISIVLAALAAAIEVGLSGSIPMEIIVPTMVFWYLIIGIGEAVISALIVLYVYKVKPDLITTDKSQGAKIEIKNYKSPLLVIGVIIVVLMVMISIGYTIGILSNDPDAFERSIIDNKSEKWLENLPSLWTPILSGIENEYLTGLIGIVLSVCLITAIFYAITRFKTKPKRKIRSKTLLPFRHQDETTFLSHIHPAIRVILPFLLVIPFLIIENLSLIITNVLIALIISLWGRLNLGQVMRRLKGAFPYVILIIVFIPFYIGKTVAFRINIGITFTLYQEGLIQAGFLFARIFGALFIFMCFFSSLTYTEFIEALAKLRLPSFFLGSLVIMLHYIPIIGTSNKKALESQELRGKKLTTYYQRLKAHALIMGKSLVSNLERSETLYESLKMRGFTGKMNFTKKKVKFTDILIVVFFLVINLSFIFLIDLNNIYQEVFAVFFH